MWTAQIIQGLLFVLSVQMLSSHMLEDGVCVCLKYTALPQQTKFHLTQLKMSFVRWLVPSPAATCVTDPKFYPFSRTTKCFHLYTCSSLWQQMSGMKYGCLNVSYLKNICQHAIPAVLLQIQNKRFHDTDWKHHPLSRRVTGIAYPKVPKWLAHISLEAMIVQFV